MKLTSSHLAYADTQQSKSNGRWTKEEHERFIEGIRKYGKNWKKVEEFVGTRTGAQIRSHAQKFFQRVKHKDEFDADSKCPQERFRFSRQHSDCSENTMNLLLESTSTSEKNLDSKKETSDSTPIRTETVADAIVTSKGLSSNNTEDNQDSQIVLEIYNSMRKFLGLPENQPQRPGLILPKPNRNSYFSHFFRFCQNFDEELVKKTKLSDILVFSGKYEKTQKRPAPLEVKSFNLAASNSEDDYMQRKLNLLTEAPLYECSESPSKKPKLSIEDC